MKTDIIKRLSLQSAMILLTGCSVLEDRAQCPCLLTLDFSMNDPGLLEDVEVLLSDAEASRTVAHLAVESGQMDDTYTFSVPRSEILVNVCSPAGMMTSDGVAIPEGEDCPLVYMHSSRIKAFAEAMSDTVLLHKNHCVMNIVAENGGMSGYMLNIKGNVCGYGRDGSPLDGKFESVPSKIAEGRFQVVLPRQKDSSLVLEIDDGTGIVKKFALGEHVASVGYDWQSPDLQDITVYMDWTLTTISVKVEEWHIEQDHEIII